MVELKTLKDIQFGKDFPYLKRDIANIEDLKHEAIKWIKELDTLSVSGDCHYNKIDKIFDYSCMACSEGCGMCGTEIIINFIKHFFNITEEDLK